MERAFVLFVDVKEYAASQGENGLGELKENYFCINPENAEMLGDMAFIDYIEENGERVGVRLLCDPGCVNAVGDGPLVAELKSGQRYKFAHTVRASGASVGSIRGYSLKLYEAGHEHHDEHGHGCDCGEINCATCGEECEKPGE